MFAAFLHVLPYVLGGALCLFLLCGFWRGLSLRPHEREHRPPPLSRYFWGERLNRASFSGWRGSPPDHGLRG
jgi:hypothetical protein